jgi:hypothetical protein
MDGLAEFGPRSMRSKRFALMIPPHSKDPFTKVARCIVLSELLRPQCPFF